MALVPQPLHIFKKDLIHLWPETLTGILLLAAFAWATPYGDVASEYAPWAKALAVLLHVLIPLAWIVMIARLVHDEALVGDRQFWTSRPYHWASLLASKVLYLLVFLYLPFFLMQVYLLHHAGLYWTFALGGLLHNLLLLTVVLIVPIMALAAVTSTLPRLLLAVLLAIVYLIIAAGFLGYFGLHRMPPPHFANIFFVIFVLLPLIALVYQYATRKTTIARTMLLATPLLVILLLLILPATAMIHGGYPVASGSDIPKVTSMADPFGPNAPPPEGKLNLLGGQVALILPFNVEGVGKDDVYVEEGTAGSVDQDGTHWDAPYSAAGNGQFQISAAQKYMVAPVAMPQGVFNKLKDAPVDVHISVLTEHLQAGTPSTWKTSLTPFAVPGHGLCSYAADDTEGVPTCRFAFGPPKDTVVSGLMTPQSCSAPAAPPVMGAVSFVGAEASALDFNPVSEVALRLNTGDRNPQHHYVLCGGVPLAFNTAKSLGKVRFELTDKAIKLDRYAVRIAPPAVGQQQPGSEPDAGPGPTVIQPQ